jgi:hypothetical protein
MARQHISSGLKSFVKAQIQSVFRLEVLLLLHGGQTRSFTAADVANELGFEPEVAHEHLEALTRNGLLSRSGNDELKYRYDPVGQQEAIMVDELAVAYTRQRVPILSLILAPGTDRIRRFAEAFRVIRGTD